MEKHLKKNIDQIDSLEGKYCLRYSLEDTPLAASVRDYGILSPILVHPLEEDRFALISGFKRFFAALTLKLAEVPVLISKEQKSEKDLFRLILELNRNGKFSELDQSVAIAKISRLDGFGEAQLREEILPLLGLAPSKKILDDFLNVSRLERNILEGIHQGKIPFRGAWELAAFSHEDQRLLWERFFKQVHVTSSELLECVSLIRDLCAMKNINLRQLIEEVSGKPLLETLKQMRFPRSYEIRKEFREKLSRLKFKSRIQIAKSESMEEEGVELRICLSGPGSLGKVIKELEAKRQALEGLV